MNLDFIYAEVERLKAEYDETDPERLCKAMSIMVLRLPMGEEPEACKGFFIKQFNVRCIVINSMLSLRLQKVVLAHELGHAVLHESYAGDDGLRDFTLFAETSNMESEANIFAADLLISDEDILEYVEESRSAYEVARFLRLPQALVDFKLRSLSHRGCETVRPLFVGGNFLKKLGRFVY